MRRTLLIAILSLTVVAAAGAEVNGTLGLDQNVLQGTTPSGLPLLFAPDPVQQGSSISHWDPTMSPNQLMEPFINIDLPDLGNAPALMRDIGWQDGTLDINLFTANPPGEGLTDPRPFPGAPGNPATTVGGARINALLAGIGDWAATLQSGVPVDVIVFYTPQFCDPAFGAVLASAGPTFVFSDDTGVLPVANVWYGTPLAEAFAGADLTGDPGMGGDGDIVVFVNSAIDEGCLGGPEIGYYYGLDGNPLPGTFPFVSVVRHELGHGFGFSNFTNETSGALTSGLHSIYDTFTVDTTTGRTLDMTTSDEERRGIFIKDRFIAWNGANAVAALAAELDPGTPFLTINSPASIAGLYPVGTAAFGPPLNGAVTADLACMLDQHDLPASALLDRSGLNGCGPAINPEELDGKIAIIERGACAFSQKVANAQAAGAVGAIIVNNAGNTPPGLAGTDPNIGIPAVGVSHDTGRILREATCPEAAGYLFDRAQVTVSWRTPSGKSGVGHAQPLTETTNWFYFRNPENVELTVKVLPGCTVNGNIWVFASGMTNIEVTITVTDTANGNSKTYVNPQGTPFKPILDTAFEACP